MTEHKTKNSCYSCGYKGTNPGSCHIRCNFNWAKAEIKPPAGNPHGINRGWYMFPLNYDPAWMVDLCSVHTKEIDAELVVKDRDPFTEAMAILGSVGRL